MVAPVEWWFCTLILNHCCYPRLWTNEKVMHKYLASHLRTICPSFPHTKLCNSLYTPVLRCSCCYVTRLFPLCWPGRSTDTTFSTFHIFVLEVQSLDRNLGKKNAALCWSILNKGYRNTCFFRTCFGFSTEEVHVLWCYDALAHFVPVIAAAAILDRIQRKHSKHFRNFFVIYFFYERHHRT